METPLDREADAQRLVGKFLQRFALMEQEIDAGIGKLLSLERVATDILSAKIPLSAKVDVLFSTENSLAARPDTERTKLLEKTKKAIMKLNEERKIFAHNVFSPGDAGGITFRRATARMELNVMNIERSEEDVESSCALADYVIETLKTLVAEMVPYKPSLDFSDKRNSGLIVLFDDF